MEANTKNELHAIISGKSQVRYGGVIQTIASYLDQGQRTSPKAEISKHLKKQETESLERFINENGLWVEVDLTLYVSEGAEQKVYLKNSESVFKLNDAIYYGCWRDYLINLLLHNFFFPDTAYKLLGFTKVEGAVFAVVEQHYVTFTTPTELEDVKRFLSQNGFQNTKNNDYYNPDLGIIIEDLHDENVLTKNKIVYFIDTVFYLTADFYK
ncbi:MAG: hypothetical protein CFE21_08815 [Bacteroidetes bacterium B1(2017)]|nr:MAG: hypothetical protein CFE21_08815 [Bacteroidetes bacterium B1(2017)]